MKKTAIFLLIIVLLTQAALLPVSAVSPETKAPAYNGYLVKLAEGAPMLFSNAMEYVVPGVYRVDDAETALTLCEYGLAVHVEPNYEVTLFDTDVEETVAWSYTDIGAATAAEWGLDGEGVRVAVVDSGLQTDNPNLDNAIIETGYDYVNNTESMSDTVGHGTYVTQLIVGDGDNGAMKGIAPKASIIPMRCFSANTADTGMLIRAVADAADPDKFACDVINMSWGSTSKSALLEAELQKAYDAGVLLVAAAGNVQADMPQGTVIYPAALDIVIGVGAIDADRNVPEFSQQTVAVDLCAPGAAVLLYNLSGNPVYGNGTSFATPCVAAVLALLHEAAPEMSPVCAKELLCRNATDLGEPGRDNVSGYGAVDLETLFSRSGWTVIETEPGTAQCWFPAPVGRTVYAAAYNAAGRMRSISAMAMPIGTCWGSCPITTDKTLTTKFITMTDDLQPFGDPIEYIAQ